MTAPPDPTTPSPAPHESDILPISMPNLPDPQDSDAASAGAPPQPSDAISAADPAAMLAAGFATPAAPADSQAAGGNSDASTLHGEDLGLPGAAQLAAEFPQLELIGLIGRGGMGVVYKARQIALDRIVAVKIIGDRIARHPQFAERFQREARAMARLSHPNILVVHEFGRTAAGRFFFVMEFVDGSNLRQVLRTGRMAPAQALQIVPQVCDALQFAHEEGVVHRDIKPENILLDRKGRVKIADFGLAKLLDAAGGGPAAGRGLTQSDMAIGTPHYMAPEQFERPLEVDHRADVYALGVVLYEMLTGELPLGRFAPPSKKVQVDVRMDEVVLRALERDPEARYQHVSEVRTGIEGAMSPPPVGASSFYGAGAPAQPLPPPPHSISGAGFPPHPSDYMSPAPQHTPPPPPVAERMSKKALWSLPVQLLPLLFLFVMMFGVRTYVPPPGEGAGMPKPGMVMALPALLCPLICCAWGLALAIGGLADIRKSGGKLGGAMAGAAGLVFLPTILLWVLFSVVVRYMLAVLIAWGSPNTNFLLALGNPAYSRVDSQTGVCVLAGLFCASFLGAHLAVLAHRRATPWIPRIPAAAPSAAGPTAARPHPLIPVLFLVPPFACLVLGMWHRASFSPSTLTYKFDVGIVSPWLSYTALLDPTGSGVRSASWSMNLFSTSGLLLALSIIFLHAHSRSAAAHLGATEASRRNSSVVALFAIVAALLAAYAVDSFNTAPRKLGLAALVSPAPRSQVGISPRYAADLLCVLPDGREAKRIPLNFLTAVAPGTKGFSTSSAFSVGDGLQAVASVRFHGPDPARPANDFYDVRLVLNGPSGSSDSTVGASFSGEPRLFINDTAVSLVVVPLAMPARNLDATIRSAIQNEGRSALVPAAGTAGTSPDIDTSNLQRPQTPVEFAFLTNDGVAYILPLPKFALPTKEFTKDNSTTVRFVSTEGILVTVRLRYDGYVEKSGGYDEYYADIRISNPITTSQSTATFKLGKAISTDRVHSVAGSLVAATPGTNYFATYKTPHAFAVPAHVESADPPAQSSPLYPNGEWVVQLGGRPFGVPAPLVRGDSEGFTAENSTTRKFWYKGQPYTAQFKYVGFGLLNDRVLDRYDAQVVMQNSGSESKAGSGVYFEGKDKEHTGSMSSGDVRLFMRPRALPEVLKTVDPGDQNRFDTIDRVTTLTLLLAEPTTRLDPVAPDSPHVATRLISDIAKDSSKEITLDKPAEIFRTSFVGRDAQHEIYAFYRGKRVNVHTGFTEDEYWIGEARTLSDGRKVQGSRIAGLDKRTGLTISNSQVRDANAPESTNWALAINVRGGAPGVPGHDVDATTATLLHTPIAGGPDAAHALDPNTRLDMLPPEFDSLVIFHHRADTPKGSAFVARIRTAGSTVFSSNWTTDEARYDVKVTYLGRKVNVNTGYSVDAYRLDEYRTLANGQKRRDMAEFSVARRGVISGVSFGNPPSADRKEKWRLEVTTAPLPNEVLRIAADGFHYEKYESVEDAKRRGVEPGSIISDVDLNSIADAPGATPTPAPAPTLPGIRIVQARPATGAAPRNPVEFVVLTDDGQTHRVDTPARALTARTYEKENSTITNITFLRGALSLKIRYDGYLADDGRPTGADYYRVAGMFTATDGRGVSFDKDEAYRGSELTLASFPRGRLVARPPTTAPANATPTPAPTPYTFVGKGTAAIAPPFPSGPPRDTDTTRIDTSDAAPVNPVVAAYVKIAPIPGMQGPERVFVPLSKRGEIYAADWTTPIAAHSVRIRYVGRRINKHTQYAEDEFWVGERRKLGATGAEVMSERHVTLAPGMKEVRSMEFRKPGDEPGIDEWIVFLGTELRSAANW